MKRTNDKKNFIWNVFGLSFYGFSSLFLLIIVRYINDIDIAGIFTYSFSLCTLFFYIALYYSRTYQIANANKGFNSFFTNRLITSFLSLIIIILFSLISSFNLYKVLIIVLLMIYRLIDSIGDTFYGYVQSNERLYQVGISYTLKTIIGILSFFIIDYYTHNLILSIIVMNIINLVILMVYDLHCYKKITTEKIRLDISNFKIILKETFPIFIFSFLCIYVANSQKIIITYFSTNDIQTIFGILIMPATVISLIGNYLINPYITKLVKLKKECNYKSFNKLNVKICFALLLISITGIILCYFIGIPVLNVIYNIDFNNYKFDLIIILIGASLYTISMILSNVFTILNHNKEQIYIYLLTAVTATITCYLLARNSVIYGASLSYLISSLVLLLIFIIRYYLIIRIKFRYNNNQHSFIICAYKEQKNLEYCIKSLLNQTIKSEVMISTSTPNDFISSMAKKYNVKLLINKEQKGHANDFRFAFKQARTKYVTLCHQDDIYLENFAEEVIDNMNKYKKPIIAFTDYYELRNDKVVKNNKLLIVKRLINFPLLLFKRSKKVRLFTLSVGNAICAPTITYNTEIIKNPVSETDFISNIDWISYIEFARLDGEFVYVKTPLLHRRIHQESLTTKVIQNNIKHEEDLKIFKMFWNDKMANRILKLYSSSEKSNDIMIKKTKDK